MTFLKPSQIIGAVAAGAAAALFISVCLDSLEMPDVWYSYSSGECVKVLNYAEDDNYSCENLPRKFNHVWVK